MTRVRAFTVLVLFNAFALAAAGGYAMDTPHRSVPQEQQARHQQPQIRHGRSRSYFPRPSRHGDADAEADADASAFDDDYQGGQFDDAVDAADDMSSSTQVYGDENATPVQGQWRQRDATTAESAAVADYVDYSRNEASGFVVERSTSPDEDGMEQSDQNVEFIEDKSKNAIGKATEKEHLQPPGDLIDRGGGSLKSLDDILNEYEYQPDDALDSQGQANDYELGPTDSDFDSYDVKKDDPRRGQVDIVTRFLRIVESQHLLGENCTAGTDLNLGEGVVDRYAQERFRVEADVAVNRANMLTRIWKYADQEVMHSEYLLHASVFSMVEFDDDIFAAGNCYDQYQYKDYWLFCPFAYRLPEGPILVKDLAVEYKYLSNTSEWFYIARKNAENVIHNYNQFSRGFNTYTYNESAHTVRVPDEILSVTYDDGKWSKPYYDCGGGNIWMLTYTVPFFGYNNGSYFFKGTSGIDIDLRRVDIDQCPLPSGSVELNIFAASDKCKKRTTECVPLPGLGFRRGSYKCLCRRGFYFPDTKAEHRYYNGTVIEEEYEKLMLDEDNQYVRRGVFECLPCAEDCEACEDASPCVVSLNWVMRTAILILSCVVICCLPFVVLFTWKYGNVKVVRAASPVLLRVITLGALFIYCTTIVMYPRPSIYTCTLRVWLREIGFSLTYGALMLKTWRISVIFRVRSAKAVKITDMDLLKRLGVIVLIFSVFLVIRTLVAPPYVIVGRTENDLKAYLCRTDWWDHSFTTLEVMFLVWGIRLCIMVRKAPSEFNESRFISMAIYNEFLLSVFLNVSMLFLQSPANPDLLYIIFFCHTQLTVTLLLCIIFGSKAYMVFKGHDKLEESSNTKHKPQAAKFLSKGRSGNSACAPSTITNSSTTVGHLEYAKLKELDVQEEFQRLYTLLEQLREKNMRLGNRHLAAKISAMQEAARHNYSDTLHEEVETIDEHPNNVLAIATEKIAVATMTAPAENGSSTGQAFTLFPMGGNALANKATAVGHPKQELAPRQHKKVSKKRCSSVGAPCLGDGDVDAVSAGDVIPSIDGNEVIGNCNMVKCGCRWSESDGEKGEVDDMKCVRCGGSRGVVASEFAGLHASNDAGRGNRSHKPAHPRTHAIVINLDDKNRFTDEVTV